VKSVRKSFSCPVCGEEVSPNARACPECGAGAKSGWRQEAHADGLDLPDDDFDYAAFVDEEFGRGSKENLPPWFWSVVAAVLLLVFATLLFRW
jgi:rubredoxin